MQIQTRQFLTTASSFAGQYSLQTTLSSPPKPQCSNGRIQQALQSRTSIQGSTSMLECFDFVLSDCLSRRAVKEGQMVHAQMIKTGFWRVYLRNRLLVFYCKCHLLRDARELFDEMPEKDVVSWTTMISGYSKMGFCSDALGVFVMMLRSGAQPNGFTFSTILTSCTGDCGIDYGRQVHSLIIRSSYDSHMYVCSSLLDMYAKAGRIHEAHVVFEGLPDRDIVACTAIISGYAQLALDEEAIGLFRKLQCEGMCSNYVTYASILTSLSGLAALNHGKQVHGHAIRLQLPAYTVLQNSIIDMYAKCGNLCYARRVFDYMPERTVISWNAMLVGYSKHGKGTEVVELFKLMMGENNVKPDSVTFLAVLTGCSHGGMEDIGMKIFDEMLTRKYGVEPKIEHYGCVIDMLGRAGRLEQALGLIKSMPFEPNGPLWGCLLGACRVHSNLHIGQYVGRQLLELEPENAGNYVILSNLYASSGRWEEVRNLRGIMEEKDVVKEPGRSWMELDQTLHTFHASDRSHPQREEVQAKVKELVSKFKEVGYEPDLSCVLYDVDDEQKEKILLGHSEKLAISFGLIRTQEGAPIRVMKNLRICVDCHNFAKFASRLCRREISIRDKNRFHHIVAGICSCGDYW
ncbi:hypothetical protein Droror1_Dr00009816 [Drosera rotundifolia]